MDACPSIAASPLFPGLIGPAFATLPDPVRWLHRHQGRATYQGQVTVERGAGMLARCCAWATRLPPAARGDIQVTIDASGTNETWIRTVGRHAMRSRLWAADGLLCERLGLVTFGFRLGIEQEQLTWRVARVRVLGIPLPPRAFTGVSAREGEDGGRYTFDVMATLPVIGLLIHYRGWLDVQP